MKPQHRDTVIASIVVFFLFWGLVFFINEGPLLSSLMIGLVFGSITALFWPRAAYLGNEERKRLKEQEELARRKDWMEAPYLQAIFFGLFSIFGVATILYGVFDDVHPWLFYFLCFGFFGMFPIMSIVAFASSAKRWSPEEEDNVAMHVFGWIFGLPMLFLFFGLIAALLFLGLHYLTTVPSWAAIIIVLLVLLLFKRTR